MSKLRKQYVARLIFRSLIFILCTLIFILRPEEFTILQGMNYFKGFSVFHLLWAIWVIDMIHQLVPVRNKIPLGSQKLFKQRFRPITEKINYAALRQYVISTTKSAYKVLLMWGALLVIIGALYFLGILNYSALFLFSAAFYVCDLICILVWCPFRLILQNRCCTTCRIYNWDHLMMFTPMIFIKGFYSISLLLMAFVIWLVWELHVVLYPERFWEHSNEALRCSECTDKLCTQYCQKLRG